MALPLKLFHNDIAGKFAVQTEVFREGIDLGNIVAH